LKREDRHIPDDVFSLFPYCNRCWAGAEADLSGGQQQQLAIGRAMVMRPKLLFAREPTEAFSPRSFKDIAARSRIFAASAISPSCSSSNISTLPASSATILRHGSRCREYAAIEVNSIPARSVAKWRYNRARDGRPEGRGRGMNAKRRHQRGFGDFSRQSGRGLGGVDVQLVDGATRRGNLHESARCACVSLRPKPNGLSAVFVNTAGGIAGGDRFGH